MSNVFILSKYIKDKEHKTQEFATPTEAVLAERAFLTDYPEAVFVVQELDGAGNLVPNREVDPRNTLKRVEAEIRPALGEIMGAAKAIIGKVEGREGNEVVFDEIKNIIKIAETIQSQADRANEVFKK